ncbi:hypothetical protein [Psychroserpens luteolus]|uniref:hypothetical protein n=1 Tax=Psychroserpens luteolus TaxID=2855840 RepID=UPI001E47CDBA|nr:hypothetical protein [Psychroserpens luteolus]MCD2258907.1 hypothetical protein [Psychroserpens luteolus]
MRDIIVLFTIIILPFLFFTYKLIPLDYNIWSSEFLSLDSEVIIDVDYCIWIFYIKVFTLSILSIWFVTNPYEWRFFIVLPIIIEVYKVYVQIANLKWGYDYKINFFESLFLSFPYILILFIFSRWTGFYIKKETFKIKINEEINTELNKISSFNSESFKAVKKDLSLIVKQKEMMNNKEYLIKLIELRDKLTL